jgi:hypothetical protein
VQDFWLCAARRARPKGWIYQKRLIRLETEQPLKGMSGKRLKARTASDDAFKNKLGRTTYARFDDASSA